MIRFLLSDRMTVFRSLLAFSIFVFYAVVKVEERFKRSVLAPFFRTTTKLQTGLPHKLLGLTHETYRILSAYVLLAVHTRSRANVLFQFDVLQCDVCGLRHIQVLVV